MQVEVLKRRNEKPLYIYINIYGTFSFVALSSMRPLVPDNVCLTIQQASSAVSHSRHVCCVTQQTCLPRDTADMSAVPHSRHVFCCVTQQTCLPCRTEDMSPVSFSRLVCCATQQTMPAAWQSRHCLGPKGAFWTRQQMRKCHIYIYIYIYICIWPCAI